MSYIRQVLLVTKGSIEMSGVYDSGGCVELFCRENFRRIEFLVLFCLEF